MGLFKAVGALFRTKAEPTLTYVAPTLTHVAWREDGGGGYMNVVGESFYQDSLLGLKVLFEELQHVPPVLTVLLVPEPENPYDVNAVAVKTQAGCTLGYLARHVAEEYQPLLVAQQKVVTCPALLTGGTADKPNVGLVLDFQDVHRLRAAR